MSLRLLRTAAFRPLTPIHTRALLPPAARTFTTTPVRRTTAGYGDPQEEKVENQTPTPNGQSGSSPKAGMPSTQPDPHPDGKGKGSGTTDPEVSKGAEGASGGSGGKGGKGTVGNAGGKEGAGNKAEENVSDSEIRETKKIGEEPKNEEVGGAGPIGG